MSALLSDKREVYLIANRGHVSGPTDRRNLLLHNKWRGSVQVNETGWIVVS